MDFYEYDSNLSTLEVSIVGAGFDNFTFPLKMHLPQGIFLYVRPEDSEDELLCKLRAVSQKTPARPAKTIRPASRENVTSMMERIARGLIFESGRQDVKIVSSEIDLRVGQVSFTYIADKKYTLNRLAARMAKLLHVRVEFNQVGARDFARSVGGLGICGMELCCKSFLKNIPSITLDLARRQGLFSAPEKLSGACGRLLCCLRYELGVYEDAVRNFPSVGSRVITRRGIGEVMEVNVLKSEFRLRYDDKEEETLEVHDEDNEWELLKDHK
jgi:cell fate regulator YaaT (PSP1 superfamily)